MSATDYVKNLVAAINAPFTARNKPMAQVDQEAESWGNDFDPTQRTAANTMDFSLIKLDADDNFRVGDAVIHPVRQSLIFHVYPNASLVTQTFFVNPTPRPLAITLTSEVRTTSGTVSTAAVTVTHEATPPSATLQQATGTGKVILSAALNLNTTVAETVQFGTLAANYTRDSRNTSVTATNPGAGLIVLQPGESLSVKFSGTLTTLVGVTITINVKPGSKYEFVSYYKAAAGTAATTSLMTFLRPRKLLFGAALWQVKEATAATLTLDVTKDASATVPGAGTSMLSATVNLKGTALTYTQLALSATAATLQGIATDSVAVKISAANTELAGLCVTLAVEGKMGEVTVNYNAANSTVGTDEEFWIADRDYEVLDFAGKWSTVSTSNTSGLTIDTGTQTPSTGTVVQTDNTNAGFLTSGTINVPVFATLAAMNKRFLQKGDRLGIKNAGTLGTLAGLQMTVRLRAM